ncbi:hypothetical protein OHA77_19700 [Streptosporangium sp. NBC_01639]|uniref:hypothetical protein n=1 Tax=Streptosporangium sp. NBC_01639 TaxID=2975948 RepID=UPI0038665F0A|nr:hypothetical protein OHA77_19700 [Streptosporangium sp. NBC_01639]
MFDSGPHVSCYRAFSAVDGSFVGVRCVKFANFVHCPDLEGVAFVWYAEGVEPAGPYRHFGEAFLTASNDDPRAMDSRTLDSRALIAHAAGIAGNSERDEPFLRLRFDVPSSPPEVPRRLVVTGDRQEEWTLVPDGVVHDYRPLPRHIERTGPHLNEFTVRKRDGTPGFGVRSMLSSGSWLGAGRWLDLTYLHLGTYIGARTGPVRFSASDIAAGNWFCGLVPWGEITVREDAEEGSSVRQVTGAWSEAWQLRHAATGWRPDPRIAGLTMPR